MSASHGGGLAAQVGCGFEHAVWAAADGLDRAVVERVRRVRLQRDVMRAQPAWEHRGHARLGQKAAVAGRAPARRVDGRTQRQVTQAGVADQLHACGGLANAARRNCRQRQPAVPLTSRVSTSQSR